MIVVKHNKCFDVFIFLEVIPVYQLIEILYYGIGIRIVQKILDPNTFNVRDGEISNNIN